MLVTMVCDITKNARPNSLLATATCELVESDKLIWPPVSVAVGAKVSMRIKGDVPAFPKLLEASVKESAAMVILALPLAK